MMEEEVLSLIMENFNVVSKIINTIKFLAINSNSRRADVVGEMAHS